MIQKPVSIKRPQRWDAPFGPEMTDYDVEYLLNRSPFSQIDPNAFSPNVSLQGIIRNDTRIVRYEKGDIVIREGDYGNSAFFILSGCTLVLPEGMPLEVLGRRPPQGKGIWAALAQLWKNSKTPEVRDVSSYTLDSRVGIRQDKEGNLRNFFQDISTFRGNTNTYRREAGTFIGELSALNRTPRSATVIAEEKTELLEIRWQGLRELRRRSKDIKEQIDSLYRARSLIVHLQDSPIFRHLTDTELKEVARHTHFETYGDFDWHASFNTQSEQSSTQRMQQEPIIIEEGHYPNGLLLISAGFARVSKRIGEGQRTVSFLGKGRVIGLEEIALNWRNKCPLPFRYSFRAIGYTDVLFVPTWIVEKFVLPSISQELQKELSLQLDQTMSGQETDHSRTRIEHELLQFLVEQRFINGTATMLIDLDRCTRCDDCVKACASTHDNNPRFIRHGKQLGKYMVANACMHCVDPVCLIGCPTGAIHRNPLQGQVIINDATCIGCATCATSCPYDNIRMVDIRDGRGHFILDQKTHTPIAKATKCDLCVDQLGGPACQRACPNDALIRINMQHVPSLIDWVNR